MLALRIRTSRSIAVAVAVATTLTVTACTDDEPEATRAELLAAIEGRPLSEVEIAERESVGLALCQFDDEVLAAMWSRMDTRQLEFQDFVFTQICADRNELYARSTGRFSSE